MWIQQPLQLKESGRWRLTVTSDEDGSGPFGDESHDHGTADEAAACDHCDAYCSSITGMMSRKQREESIERKERAELERLKAKYEPQAV